MLVLKLPRFLSHRNPYWEWKNTAITKQTYRLTPSSCFYDILALIQLFSRSKQKSKLRHISIKCYKRKTIIFIIIRLDNPSLINSEKMTFKFGFDRQRLRLSRFIISTTKGPLLSPIRCAILMIHPLNQLSFLLTCISCTLSNKKK